jgi:hypothetical protein
MANRHRGDKLRRCRRLLLPWSVAGGSAPAEPSAVPEVVTVEPAPLPRCPECGGGRFVRSELPKGGGMGNGDTS